MCSTAATGQPNPQRAIHACHDSPCYESRDADPCDKTYAPYNARNTRICSPSLEPGYAGERDTDWSESAERAAPDDLSEAPTPRRDTKVEALEEESCEDGRATDEDECTDEDDSEPENTSARANCARPDLQSCSGNDTEQCSYQEDAAPPLTKRARPAAHPSTSETTTTLITQHAKEEEAVAWFRSLASMPHFLPAHLPAPMCDNSWSVAEHERTALDIIAGAAW